MARKRMIDPGFWEDPTIGTLSIPARLLFIGMISHADDDGRLEVEPRYLRRAVFGFDDVMTSEVVALLDEIRGLCRSVHFYAVGGRSFASFRNWKRYQYIQKPQGSRLPPPPDDGTPDPSSDEYDTDNGTVTYEYDTTTVSLSDNRIEKNRIGIEKRESARANTPDPSLPPPDENPFGSIYREIFGRSLTPPELAYVAARVTDPHHWREVCEDWMVSGYKVTNLAGLVDRYRKPPDAPAGQRSYVAPRVPVGLPLDETEAEIKIRCAARKAELLKGLPSWA